MKIKQLKWEDCTPTISSDVASRVRVLGYDIEVCLNHTAVDENEENDEVSYTTWAALEPIRDVDTGFPRKYGSIEEGKAAGQAWLEARIREAVEVK